MNKKLNNTGIDEELWPYDPDYKENPKDFPANLVADIFGSFFNHYKPDMALKAIEYFRTDSDVRKTVDEILSMLKKEEEKFIRGVFERGKSLNEIAKEQKESLEKINNLRHLSRMHIINPTRSKCLKPYFEIFDKKNNIAR